MKALPIHPEGRAPTGKMLLYSAGNPAGGPCDVNRGKRESTPIATPRQLQFGKRRCARLTACGRGGVGPVGVATEIGFVAETLNRHSGLDPESI